MNIKSFLQGPRQHGTRGCIDGTLPNELLPSTDEIPFCEKICIRERRKKENKHRKGRIYTLLDRSMFVRCMFVCMCVCVFVCEFVCVHAYRRRGGGGGDK